MTVAPLLVAALADRYRIERELGAGGMATVYLAVDLKHERQVAIKVLREDLPPTLCCSCLYDSYILVHMKTTLNIDDDLLAEAERLTSIGEKTALVRAGLEALIAREQARRLARLGGTEPKLRATPRRRGVPRRVA